MTDKNNLLQDMCSKIDEHSKKILEISNDHLPLSGGNITGNLTVQNKNVATEDFVNDSINNLSSTYLGISAKAESAKSADSVAWDNVSDKPSTFTPSSHTHDDRYYTESEIDTKLTDYLPLAGGNVTGNLTVQNKNVDVIEEQGDWYIRYANGIQICWGTVKLNNVSSTEVYNTTSFTFPKSFILIPVVSHALIVAGSGWADFTLAASISTTQVTFWQYTNRGIDGTFSVENYVDYIAIGRWK